MANNRLYIVDRNTGEAFCLAKAMGEGWYVAVEDVERKLNAWFDGVIEDGEGLRDFTCSIGGKQATQLVLVDENHCFGNAQLKFSK